MFNCLVYILFFCFLFSEDVLFSVGDRSIYKYDFFQQIPFGEWSSLDSLSRSDFENSFLSKELSYIESLDLGLNYHSDNFIKLQQRHRQLLINNTYEHLVAHPMIESRALALAEKNILDQVLVHHILVGYDGCKLSGVFDKSQDDALAFATKLQQEFLGSTRGVDSDSLFSVFSSFAIKNSDDPSVENNAGLIGWVSWGRVMPAFQEVAFSLAPLALSAPVLTPFGYHLILVQEKKPSDYFYYNPLVLKDLSKKLCLQSLSFDSLKQRSQAFDSLLLFDGGFKIKENVVDSLLLVVNQKYSEGLRGNKSSYLQWFKEKNLKEVLFVFKGGGFGVGWFLNELASVPSTRVPSLRSAEDFVSLLKSVVLQKEAVLLGNKNKVHLSPFFKQEYLKHEKNILYNEYVSFLINSLPPVDSLVVEKKYSKGTFRGDYIKPRSVVYSEIKTKTREEIDAAYNLYLSLDDFDFVLKEFGGDIKNPVSLGRGGPLATTAFDLKVGEVSSPIENANKTFSLIRVESFVEEEPFTLDKVYKQIERQIKKSLQDSIKNNLVYNLKNKYGVLPLNIK